MHFNKNDEENHLIYKWKNRPKNSAYTYLMFQLHLGPTL